MTKMYTSTSEILFSAPSIQHSGPRHPAIVCPPFLSRFDVPCQLFLHPSTPFAEPQNQVFLYFTLIFFSFLSNRCWMCNLMSEFALHSCQSQVTRGRPCPHMTCAAPAQCTITNYFSEIITQCKGAGCERGHDAAVYTDHKTPSCGRAGALGWHLINHPKQRMQSFAPFCFLCFIGHCVQCPTSKTNRTMHNTQYTTDKREMFVI